VEGAWIKPGGGSVLDVSLLRDGARGRSDGTCRWMGPRRLLYFLDGCGVFTMIGDAEWGPALENGQKNCSQQSGIAAVNHC